MKKILIGCLISSLAFSGLQAIDFTNGYKVGVKSGISFLNTKIKHISKQHDKGLNLGIEITKPINDKLEAEVEVNTNIYDNFEMYNVELNSKYLVYNKTKLITGISYNLYSISGTDSFGAGLQFGIERNLMNNLDLILKYKYIDLNKQLSYANELLLGLKYNF